MRKLNLLISIQKAGTVPIKTLAGQSLIILILIAVSAYAAELKVTFFDVGQGDSSLIEFPNGKTVLIDAGMNYAEAASMAQVKPSPIVPYLKNENKKNLDIVLITHPHPDHIGGLPEVMKNVRTKTLYGFAPTPVAADPQTGQTISQYDAFAFLPPPVGKKIKNGGAEIEFLSPPAPFIGTDADDNNNSVVAKVTYGKFSVLFAGDIEWAGEFALVDMPDKIRSTILKVPHHGSHTSSTSPFIDRVAPEAAIITCGKGNAYGHPHQSTIEQLQKRKIKIYRTDENGTITAASNGTVYTITTEY